eukprot:318156-Rhodomonas_salina.1
MLGVSRGMLKGVVGGMVLDLAGCEEVDEDRVAIARARHPAHPPLHTKSQYRTAHHSTLSRAISVPHIAQHHFKRNFSTAHRSAPFRMPSQ